MTMEGEVNKPRRRTSTSVSPANGSLDLACDRDISIKIINSIDDDMSASAVKASATSTQRRRSTVSTAFLLASLALFALYVSVGRWKGARSHVGDFLAGKNEEPEQMPSLGILLHPENHRSRKERITTLHWTITSDFRAPDGVKKRVYLINGEFPGPTIEVRSGDTLIVHVENALESPDEGLSIHWHGLYMKEHNSMDGAVGFTQCAILPGRNFTYEFGLGVEQYGTFWYHADSQAERADGLYGGLVIHRPSEGGVSEVERYGYQREVLLMVSDWYHRPAAGMSTWYPRVGAFGNEPVPDSLVINGHGAFNCSMAVTARPNDCTKIKVESLPSIFGYDLAPTRLRLVNTGSNAGLSFAISYAKMTPLQVDGGCEINGSPSDYVGILYPGERADVLVKWSSEVLSTGSELEIVMDPENFNFPNPSLTPNQTFPVFPPFEAPSPSPIPPLTLPPPAMPTEMPAIQSFNLQTAQSASMMRNNIPISADQIILVYAESQKQAMNNKRPMGFINRTSWTPQNPPLISILRSDWDEHQLIAFIPLPDSGQSTDEVEKEDIVSGIDDENAGLWVDLIINNLDDSSHPFHLHGHDFYVLATHRSDRGWGSYSPYSAAASNVTPELNIERPLRKDTINVPRRGYVVVRFKANNKGLWMLHCHVLVHFGSGMAMGLQIGEALGVEKGTAELCV